MGLFRNREKEEKEEKEYLESLDIDSMQNEDFCLEIEEPFVIVGVGTVVTGYVTSGMCRSNEEAILQKANEEIETRIMNIDVHTKMRRANGVAYRGEHVGIHIRGIAKEQVSKGDKLIVKRV